MQGTGQIQSFHSSYSLQTYANASAVMPSFSALPASAANQATGGQMRYTRLSDALPQTLEHLREKRGTISEKGPSPVNYPGLPPQKPSGGAPPKPPPEPSNKSVRRPFPAQQTPAPLLGLQDFFDARHIQVQVKTAPADTLKHLHTLLLSGTKKSAPSFSAGELPLSQTLITLTGQLLKSYGFHEQVATMPEHMDDVYLRRLVADLLIALIIPERSASEINFNSFNFLSRIRGDVSVATETRNFLLQVGYYLGRPGAASEWAASLILSSLHPELARTDTPHGLMCGSLEWADLKAAIDMLGAAGIDHGNFSHTELIGFARESAAGAKLNNAVGKELWRIQTPTALWYAHANGHINLAVHAIDVGATIQTAIDYLDGKRVAALKAPLPRLMSAINALQEKLKTREEIARNELMRLGLKPDTQHQMYDERWLRSDCRGKRTILASYLKDCLEIVEHAYCLRVKYNACTGKHVAPLDRLVQHAFDKFDRKRATAFADVLNVVLKNGDAQTLNDWQADTFTVLMPMLKQVSKGINPSSVEAIHADTGVIVNTIRKNISRFYAVSTRINNVIEAIEITDVANITEDHLAAYVLSRHADYFDEADIAPQPPHMRTPYASLISFKPFPSTPPSLPAHIKAVVDVMLPPSSDATINKPNIYLAAAEQLKHSFTPFDYCIAAIADESAEASKKLCHVDLGRMDTDALQRLHFQPEKNRYLEELTRAKVAPEVARDASEHFKTQLSIHSVTQRASTFRTVLHDMGHAVIAVPDNPNRPYRLPRNSIRLTANPAASNRFFSALAKMLGRNPSMQRIQQQLEIAGNRPMPIALPPIFSSTLFTGKPGEIALRLKIPPNTELRQIPDPEREAEGLVTFSLNGLDYQIDLYSFAPSLTLLSDIRRHTEDLPLCREERALPATATGAQACETTEATSDENSRRGRIINHPNLFIQLAPLEGRVQRPRREATIFFPENQAPSTFANVVIIDQILFRGPVGNLSARDLLYKRVPSEDHQRNFPPLRPLPPEMEGSLRDRGLGERPMIEYTLTSEDVPDAGTDTHTRQIRTRIRRDFLSLHSSTGDARGLVEVSAGHYYAFDFPPFDVRGPVDVTLRRVTDQALIAEFTGQEDAEHAVRSAPFTVNIRGASAATLIHIIWKCEATKILRDAFERSARSTGIDEDTVLTNALMTYVGSYTGVSVDAVPQAVLEQLNIALTDIMRSVGATRDLRVLLRENYQLYRPNVRFDEIPVPLRPPSSPTASGIPAEIQAMENQLRETLDLFSTIFPGLNFAQVWTRQRSHDPSALTPRSRLQIITDEFIRVFDRRNVAVAIVQLKDGRTVYYFSVSGSRVIPDHIQNNPNFILAREMPPLGAQLPDLPNLSSSFSEQARGGDTERMLGYRVQTDFPDFDAVEKISIVSLLEICQSCTICCIALGEQYKNATMEFSSFPPAPKIVKVQLPKAATNKTIEL
jgi:hypothetical protein